MNSESEKIKIALEYVRCISFRHDDIGVATGRWGLPFYEAIPIARYAEEILSHAQLPPELQKIVDEGENHE